MSAVTLPPRTSQIHFPEQSSSSSSSSQLPMIQSQVGNQQLIKENRELRQQVNFLQTQNAKLEASNQKVLQAVDGVLQRMQEMDARWMARETEHVRTIERMNTSRQKDLVTTGVSCAVIGGVLVELARYLLMVV